MSRWLVAVRLGGRSSAADSVQSLLTNETHRPAIIAAELMSAGGRRSVSRTGNEDVALSSWTAVPAAGATIVSLGWAGRDDHARRIDGNDRGPERRNADASRIPVANGEACDFLEFLLRFQQPVHECLSVERTNLKIAGAAPRTGRFL